MLVHVKNVRHSVVGVKQRQVNVRFVLEIIEILILHHVLVSLLIITSTDKLIVNPVVAVAMNAQIHLPNVHVKNI